MTQNPIEYQNREIIPQGEEFFRKFINPTKQAAVAQVLPLQVDFELNNKCAGSCLYCCSASDTTGEISMPTEKVLSLIDEFVAFGIKQVIWPGGDPLLHPDCFNIWHSAGDKGLRNFVVTSGLISKKAAREITANNSIKVAGIHIDTLNQEIYNQVHGDPQGLAQKIQGYRNLLEAGFSPQKVFPCITLTKPALESIEETLDWYIDEMGTIFVDLIPFRPVRFGNKHRQWEPNISDLKRAFEYRAKKLGENWLRIGPMECSKFFCKTTFNIACDGRVFPCGQIPDLVVGNVFEQSIQEIFAQKRDLILFDCEIKGKCGDCEHNDVCFGCRASAHHYTGDVWESDPKCWLNPAAKDV